MKILVALVLSFALAASAALSAQSIRPEAIENEAIGWMRVYNFTGATAPLTVDQRRYSAAQLSIGQMFANWIQATYVPVGGLGDVIRSVSEKLNPYNQNTAALPQSYGAYAKIYTDLKYGANRKMEPASNSHVVWSIMANGFYGSPADALSTPEHYYFTLPSFDEQGYGTDLERAVDVSTHPILGRFPAYFQRNSVNGNRKYVMVARDNRLPFVTITRGEYLTITEAAVTRLYTTEKSKIFRDNQGNQRFIDSAMKYLDDKHAKRLAVLESNREKYKDRLKETATIFTTEPDALLENYPDVFEGNGGSRLRLPVYTIDPVLAERCKTDAPQWIVVSWTAQLNDPVIRHLHEAVVTRFNFEYLYNYFFDPDKVKGQPYTPLLALP